MQSFLKKIREFDERKKKIIFWSTIVILGIILFLFYIKEVDNKIRNLQNEGAFKNMNIPGLKENMDLVPSQDIGDAAKQIQEILNQNKNETEKEAESK